MKTDSARSPTPRKPKRSRRADPGAAAGRANDGAELPIVGIGASAGGLDAFKKLFGAMPADGGLAFVLIQHLDPTRPSLTADLVGTYTTMRVTEADDGMQVEPNRVYVIPPNKYLSVHERVLRLSAPSAPRSMRMAIDHFFYSLAEAQRERAIGIVLSGTGTDGTLGMKEIKAAGGMTMAQDPETAQHDGMPRSAIAAGSADYVLPAERMAEALLAYRRHATFHAARTETPQEESADLVMSVVAALRVRMKFDFSGYRRGTLERRIRRRMSLKHVVAISDYVDLLRREPAEVTALFNDLLISVTSFFREPAAWQTLQEQAIRRLVTEKERDVPLRVWVPACATGAEAYSIAIVMIEEIEASGKNHRLQVFASDVDVRALETARSGVYPEGIAARMTPERLSRFFVKTEHGYQVTKDLRDTVVFAQQSLVSDPPFSRLDAISCRNFLIYLEPAVQERIVALLHFALVEGGCLFLGSAESIGTQNELFEPVSRKWRIYRRIGPTRHDKVRLPISAAPAPDPAGGRSRGEPNPGRLSVLAQQLLVERYVPACVIINRSAEVLYFHGRTDEYLMQPAGPPTRDLIARARGGLRSGLRAAVQEAVRKSQRVVITGVPVRRGSAFPHVRVAVEPLDAGNEAKDLWLVSFEDEPEPAPPPVAPDDDGKPGGGDETFVRQLEKELSTTREDLQHTIEDVSAANEELMSVTEEMQSSNEELETSKEELQSLNEELTTANAQLESKIGELEASNNDLDNLLISTNIATLFLDVHLRIRGFTPSATGLFSLIPSDVGRPLSDIAPKFSDPTLLSDAATVLEKSTSPKKEVQGHDGRWYVRQVLPYRTRDGRTEGVVVTFSDVAAEALQEARLYAESIVDTVREPLLVLDEDFCVRSANQSFYATFRTRPEEAVGRLFYEVGNRQWDIPELRTRLEDVLTAKRVLNDFEVVRDFDSVGRRILLLNARAIDRGAARPDLILLGIEDVTERRQAQDALRESESRKEAAEQVRERHAQLEHALRISTVGVLASGLAHELSQPLSAIANEVEACVQYVASGKIEADNLLGLLEEVSAEALRAGEIVDHLRGFIQKGEPQLEHADLGEVARQVARLLGQALDREAITLRLDAGSEAIPIFADRIQIEQVVVNFMQNAIDAVREHDGRKEIALHVRRRNTRAELTVRDSGAGVPAAAEERLWEPFFSTKPKGLGMGLAISRSIIEAHRGRIWVGPANDGSQGTIARFTLPLRPPRHRLPEGRQVR
jgi:two-component system, chemotaxis family, CheB/CheR fusion protein